MSPADAVTDRRHMAHALSLAQRALGRTAPNPAVGCVLVQHGRIAGRGHTQPGGRPHAESVALAQAGAQAAGATAYVTLEPCAHHGQTPPCADALIDAGIARCVVALKDPDPRVAGAGLARLEQAGLDVTVGVLGDDAARVTAGFLSRISRQRPLVTAKLATTLDGKIATATGASKWITGALARQRSHLMRAQHDAILVGINTVLADDPDLTVRLPGLEDRSPLRIVLDRMGRLPADSRLVRTAADRPTWLITESEQRLPGVETVTVKTIESLGDVLHSLADRGITRLLVEGGAGVHGGFFRAGLVDRIAWFRAAGILGAEGLSGVGDLAIGALADMPRFRRVDVLALGDDMLELYDRAEA